ncbi:hypothetical protein F5Y18DRAFT_437842 [Xylariaceae sp. FL1019]|nr:hypothetical protein F5Y18DRAFT_437842 [Xylariaceae sp. FL1019]
MIRKLSLPAGKRSRILSIGFHAGGLSTNATTFGSGLMGTSSNSSHQYDHVVIGASTMHKLDRIGPRKPRSHDLPLDKLDNACRVPKTTYQYVCDEITMGSTEESKLQECAMMKEERNKQIDKFECSKFKSIVYFNLSGQVKLMIASKNGLIFGAHLKDGDSSWMVAQVS